MIDPRPGIFQGPITTFQGLPLQHPEGKVQLSAPLLLAPPPQTIFNTATPVAVQVADHPDTLPGVGDLRNKVVAADLLQAAEARPRDAGLQLLDPALPVLLQEAVVAELVLRLLQPLRVLPVQALGATGRLCFGGVGLGLPDRVLRIMHRVGQGGDGG